MTQEKANLAQESIGLVLAITSVSTGVIIGLYQIYHWLRSSHWKPVSLNDALIWMEIRWASFPTDWLGLHAALNWIPLSITLIFAPLFIAYLVSE